MGKKRKLITTIRVVNPARQLKRALIIIEKFRDLNKIKFNRLYIKLDYSDNDLGHYFFKKNLKSCTIYINPESCYRQEVLGYKGHPEDLSLETVAIHEFSHFIDDILSIKKMYNEVRTTFKNRRFYINEASQDSLTEEVAEMLTMFLLNPYMIKLIDSERYDWITNILKLKPVSLCTPNGFFKVYRNWCPQAKKELKEKFHLIINEKKRIVKRKKYIRI